VYYSHVIVVADSADILARLPIDVAQAIRLFVSAASASSTAARLYAQDVYSVCPVPSNIVTHGVSQG
jgi:hypothetical protein